VFEKAGLLGGDEIVTISTHSNAAVVEIADGRPGPVTLQVRRGDAVKDVTIEGEHTRPFDAQAAGFLTMEGGVLGLEFNRIQRRWGFKDAIVTGMTEPVEMIGLTFKILGKLFVREEDASGLAGPIGIFKASVNHAETGIGNFLWLLVLITVNLGIFNLLPVPVLDGGHILLLAIEKVKGSPPSARFVERFQLVGLVLLLSLLIFVTVNDLR
jgi:regulator of sigma E protease